MSLTKDTPRPVFMAHLHAAKFTPEFLDYIAANVHVFEAFEMEALKIAARGAKHYSARTIIEVLRHHSALQETGPGIYKLNDRHTPFLARLFALCHPDFAGLFEFREAKSVKAARAGDSYGAGLRSAFEAMGAGA
jgi:hypothetical protein